MSSALSAAVIINPFLLTVEELFHRVLVEFFIVINEAPIYVLYCKHCLRVS